METFEEKRVQLALTALDPNLFLDKMWDKEGQYIYYAVRCMVGPDVEPFITVEWRSQEGPFPLSLDIVDRVRAQEGSIKEAFTQAMVNNAAKAELRKQELEAQIDDKLEWAEKSRKKLGIYGPWSNKANVD